MGLLLLILFLDLFDYWTIIIIIITIIITIMFWGGFVWLIEHSHFAINWRKMARHVKALL